MISYLSNGAPTHIADYQQLDYDFVSKKLYRQETNPTGTDWVVIAIINVDFELPTNVPVGDFVHWDVDEPAFDSTPELLPTLDYEQANKKYVDDSSGGGGGANLSITFEGGGAAIAVGTVGYMLVPFDCEVQGWTILEASDTPITCSIVVDVWNRSYASYPPTVAQTIAGTEKPTITTGIKGRDLTLTTWTPALTKGSVLAYKVDSNTDAKRVVVSLHVTPA